MRSYKVPPDINEKEKVIGGIIDFSQFLWCLLGVGCSFGVFGLLAPIIGKLAFLPAFIVLVAALPLAFLKVKGIPLPEYLKRKRKFNKKSKYLPNIRQNRIY